MSRAVARTHNSYELNASYRGHNNSTVLKQVHSYIKYLVSIGVFPASCIVGRLTIGRMTRTGLALTIDYLEDNKDQIFDALEDKYENIDPDEVYRIFQQGIVFAAYNGLIELPHETCQRFADLIAKLPKSVQCMVLGRTEYRQSIVKSISDKSTNV